MVQIDTCPTCGNRRMTNGMPAEFTEQRAMDDKDRVLTLAEAEKVADYGGVVKPIQKALSPGIRVCGQWYYPCMEGGWDTISEGSIWRTQTGYRVLWLRPGITLTDILGPEKPPEPERPEVSEKEPGRWKPWHGEPLGESRAASPDYEMFAWDRADGTVGFYCDSRIQGEHYRQCVNAIHEAGVKVPGELAGFMAVVRTMRSVGIGYGLCKRHDAALARLRGEKDDRTDA